MSNFTIPNNRGEIRQVNSGDLFGELNETFNIDLTTSQGKIKVSKPLEAVLTEGVNIGTPSEIIDMLIWNNQYYILTEDEVYRCSVNDDPTDASNWTEETDIADLDSESSAVIFDGEMRISLGDDILSYDGSTDDVDWWTNVAGGTALNANVPHTLEVVQSGKETLYVTDGDRIQYLEKGNTPKIVQLDSNVVSCCLAPGLSGAMWVGAFNETSGQAQVYEIYTGETLPDSATPVYRQAYPVNALAVLAIWMRDNTPFIVTETGEIQAFNGAGFTTVAEFPFKFADKPLGGASVGSISTTNRVRPIHPRGVKTHNDSVYINVKTRPRQLATPDEYPVDVKSHSGVWEFNMKTGVLNHRYSFANQIHQNDTGPILVLDNEFTFLFATGKNMVDDTFAIYMEGDGTPKGWFITPEINSGTVADAYESVYHKAKTMASGEEIVTMYRTTKRDTVRGTLNWTGTTTCTTTDDFSNVEVGDLIRVVSGTSPGEYANIVSIEPSASTYTITVDRAIGSTGTTSNVYCDNFKKDPEAYTSEDGEVKRLGGYGTNPWIQFAVFLKGAIEYRSFNSVGNSKKER